MPIFKIWLLANSTLFPKKLGHFKFKLCDMVCYRAGSSHQKMNTLW